MTAVAERCPFGCTVCSRHCQAAQRQSHRFDCCGVIRAHAPVLNRRGEKDWQDIANPMSRGYLTGPSQTVPRGRAS